MKLELFDCVGRAIGREMHRYILVCEHKRVCEMWNRKKKEMENTYREGELV